MTKSELRNIFLEKRRGISAVEHERLSAKIADRFFTNFDLRSTSSLHCFISLKHTGEVETSNIFERLWDNYPQIRTFAPRINDETGEIDAIPVRRDTKLIENKWRILEPVNGAPADPNEIDLVLVPLLCFDERGFRVGYGKGFYDRFLAKCRLDCQKVGLSFFPPVEAIDDAHESDFPLDLCITPETIYRPDELSEK